MSENDPAEPLPLPLPSTSNPFLQIRRRTNAAGSNRGDKLAPNESQLDTIQMDTSNGADTSSYSQASRFSTPDSNEPFHSSPLKKFPSNPKMESSEKESSRNETSENEDPVGRRENAEPTCADLSRTRTNQTVDTNEQPEEEPLCRICLGGRDDDDPALGRFIQPCLCRGTMAYIHVGCLQRWRITSPSLKSFYRCDQCGYQYKLRRAKIAGLAQNKAILGGLTLRAEVSKEHQKIFGRLVRLTIICQFSHFHFSNSLELLTSYVQFMIFFILVIVSGFIAGWLLESYTQITTADATWDDGLSPFSYDSTGKIVGEVVGEAVRVLNSKLHVGTSPPGGTTPVSRSKFTSQAQSERQVSKLKAIQTDENDAHSYRYVRAKNEKNNQDQPVAVYSTRSNNQLASETRKHSSSSENLEEQSPDDEQEGRGNSKKEHIFQSILSGIFLKLEALIKHTIKGLAFIGVMSFFQLAMSVTLFSPWNFGIRNSVLRMMRTGTGGTRTPGRPGDPNGIGSVLILLFVLLGVLKAIQSVWKFVRKSSQWALRKIEDGVLDVRSS